MTAEQLELGQAPAPLHHGLRSRGRESADSDRSFRRLTSAATGLEIPVRGVFEVPPGDWARPGLVDRGFVERSVAAMRAMPDAKRQLRDDMAERLASIGAIDLVYRGELNAWAAKTRERLWLEYFTAGEILRDLARLPS